MNSEFQPKEPSTGATVPDTKQGIDKQKEIDKENAENPNVGDQSPDRIMEMGVTTAKDRVKKHLTVLNTVHASLKSVVNQLTELNRDHGNNEISTKLDLAEAQLESVANNF